MPQLRPLALVLLLIVFAIPLRADDERVIANFKPRAGNLSAASLSEDGKLLLLGEDDGLLTIWNVKTGKQVQNFKGHWPRAVFAAALLPDRKRLVSCGDDNTLMVLDIATGNRLQQMSTGDSIPWTMSSTSDGALAAAGCNDGQIFIWDLAHGRRVATLRHDSPIYSLQFSPDARTLAAGYSDGHVILWNTSTWSASYTLPTTNGASVGALAFSPDSRLLATGNQNGAGFVWNVADGTQFSSFAGYAHPEVEASPHVAPPFPGSSLTPPNRSTITFLCFSPDSKSILASIQDASARFWDTKTGRFLGTADWFDDDRFYVARYGFPFTTSNVTPYRDFIVNFQFNADQFPEYYLAQVWRLTFTPDPPQQ